MRAVMAAVVGAVLALGVALVLVPVAHQGGATSPRPLLTSAPAHP